MPRKQVRGADVPDWIKEPIQEARKLLYVTDDWHIGVEVVDKLEIEGEECDGDADVDPRYLTAKLRIAARVADYDYDERMELALHEVGHILHAECEVIFKDMRRQFSPVEQALFTEQWRDAQERFLQRLSRGWMDHMKLAEESAEEKA